MDNTEVTAIQLDKLTPYRQGNVMATAAAATYVEHLRDLIQTTADEARAKDDVHAAEFIPVEEIQNMLAEMSGRLAYDIHHAAGLPIPEPIQRFGPKK